MRLIIASDAYTSDVSAQVTNFMVVKYAKTLIFEKSKVMTLSALYRSTPSNYENCRIVG